MSSTRAPSGAGAHGVRHITRRAPEVAFLHGNLLITLDADGGAVEQHAPLLLGMMVQRALRMRRQRHHRQHRLLAGEDARGHPCRELAKQPVAVIVEIVEFVLLAHAALLFILADQDLPYEP